MTTPPDPRLLSDKLDTFDAGLLPSYEDGPVSWWQDAIRSLLSQAHDHYQQQYEIRIAAQRAEIERLNQMLRDHGYGQGQIDAYVAQCEEIERLRAEK
jgi:hypothetical protein